MSAVAIFLSAALRNGVSAMTKEAAPLALAKTVLHKASAEERKLQRELMLAEERKRQREQPAARASPRKKVGRPPRIFDEPVPPRGKRKKPRRVIKVDLDRKAAGAAALRAARRAELLDRPLRADFFYRMAVATHYFGLSNAHLYQAIKEGAIPAPVSISDGGRARGWFGRQIIAWQQERLRKAVEKKSAQAAASNEAEAHPCG
jgi:predicted DNA-binding transcriptional regulator AlpA